MARSLHCLLIVSIVLTNLGQHLGHVHQSDTFATKPSDHASRPHFHFGKHSGHFGKHSGASHEHQHGHHSHAAPKVDASDRSVGASQLTSAGTIAGRIGDHDSDAVYCGPFWTGTRETESVSIASAKVLDLVALRHLAYYQVGSRRLGSESGHPPSEFESGCPIYLRNLSLRI